MTVQIDPEFTSLPLQEMAAAALSRAQDLGVEHADLRIERIRTSNLALHDARLELDDIEAVVYSLSPDAMVGIGNAERLGIDAVGGRNKRFLRINTGGATGISAV